MTEFLTHRTCARCREAKPESSEFFAPDSRRKSGWNPYCRPCVNAVGREAYHKRMTRLPEGEAARRVEALARSGEVSRSDWPLQEFVSRIGCLQCRHGAISFETEFRAGNTSPTVFCGRMGADMDRRGWLDALAFLREQNDGRP